MLKLSVCVGTACHLKGSNSVIQLFKQMIEQNRLHDEICLEAIHCTKNCSKDGVTVLFENRLCSVRPENARVFFRTAVLPIVVETRRCKENCPA